MPPKTDLNVRIFGRVDRGDHTMEKVYFESYPGFYVTGNLYRPKGKTGKLPAVLCPHGHWTYGRLENTDLNSGPARAANFARQGYVAFAYDMVGYNDSAAIGHRYSEERHSLWSISLLGLQLWNSIRAVDFLLSLPEVDAERIGCTGESGGGTQTFLLAAVDDRIRVSAPVNMISAHMQGGDLCENAPNLRIDTYNVEFGAMMAPRPMLMVSATGDWTKDTLTVEYPDIRSIYRFLGAEDKVQAVQMNAPHNYNRESREAVYGWFAHWLLGRAETTPIKERPGGVASLSEQLVFFGLPRPTNELNEAQLTESLIQMARRQLEEARPRDAAGLERFREQFGTALKYSLMAEYPKPEEIIASAPEVHKTAKVIEERFVISRRGRSDRVQVTVLKPTRARASEAFVLVVDPALSLTRLTNVPESRDPVAQLIAAGHTVASVVLPPNLEETKPPGDIKFFTTYNRTYEANRIQDILTALAYLNGRKGSASISVIGLDRAGLWALLARGLAPRIDRMVVDAAGFDNTSDDAFLKSLAIPGLRRAGDFFTAAAIAPLTPLLIHNTGGRFRTDGIAEVYKTFGRSADFSVQSNSLNDSEIMAWLSANKQ
jgi:dienelactone hydrolase